jgi:hypothetical protein
MVKTLLIALSLFLAGCDTTSHLIYVLDGSFTTEQEQSIQAGANVWNDDTLIQPKIDVVFEANHLHAGDWILSQENNVPALDEEDHLAIAVTIPYRHMIVIDTRIVDGTWPAWVNMSEEEKKTRFISIVAHELGHMTGIHTHAVGPALMSEKSTGMVTLTDEDRMLWNKAHE